MGNPYAPPGENPRPAQQPEQRPSSGGGEAGAGGLHGGEPGEQPGGHPGRDRDGDRSGGARPGDERGGAPVGGPHDAGASPSGWPGPQLPAEHGLPQHGGMPQQRGPEHGSHQGQPAKQRPEPDSPIVRATSRRILHFLALLLAVVVTSGLPLPWQLGSLALLVAAIVVGLRALVLAWRGGVRGGLVIMLGVGVGAAAVVGLTMLSLVALWPQQMDRQECLARAVTLSANRACEAEFQRAVDELLGGTATSAASRS